MAHLNTNETDTVQIVATFEHSPFVEMAIHDLGELGVPPRNIVALPLENLESQVNIVDSIHRVDGRSILDGAMMGGTILAVLGAIYGFVLYWGPVIWGLLGLAGGFFLGLIIELALNKKKLKLSSSRKSEVIIEVTCNASLKDQLIKVFKIRKATGFVTKPQSNYCGASSE